jgi:hypothetical protein
MTPFRTNLLSLIAAALPSSVSPPVAVGPRLSLALPSASPRPGFLCVSDQVGARGLEPPTSAV